MCKFVKKTVIIGGILALAGFLVFGAGLSSYMRTGYKQVRSQLKSSIPIEFEIHRIEDLIEQIGPEMSDVKRLVAEEQVSIRELKQEIVSVQHTASQKSEDVKLIRTSLDTTTPRIRLGGIAYTRQHVETDLARRLDNLKALHALVDSKNRLLLSRERALDAARNKLVSINGERTRLETLVQQLRAELREQQTLESSCLNVKIDESKLKQAQELAARVQRRLAVNREILKEAGVSVDPPIEIQREIQPVRDIRTEVDAYFANEDRPLLEEAPARLSRN